MPFIIPNATDVGGGLKYFNINQSEPDSLDIEALGLRNNWIRSGGEVTVSGGALVAAAGVAIINGKPYSFSALSPVTPTPAANARFDVVVARLTGSTVSVAVVTGTDSSTNPTLPKSRSVMVSGFSSSTCVDPATDVLLAAVYVDGGVVVSSHIVDKRIIDPRPVSRAGTSVPTDQDCDVIGDVVIYGGVTYVKVNDTTWDQLATAAGVALAGFPIGSIFAWPGIGNPDATQYKECDGTLVSKTTYSALYAALKGGRAFSPYGENGGSFYLPKVNDGRVIVGDVVGNIGDTGGVNSTVLTETNMPSHTHTVNIANHGGLTHDSVDQTSAGGGVANFNVNAGGSHNHSTRMHTHTGALVYRVYNNHNGYHIGQDTSHSTDAFHVDALGVNEELPGNPYLSVESDAVEAEEERLFKETSNPDTYYAGSHQHSFAMNSHTIPAHSVTVGIRGSSTTTDNVSGTAFTNQPLYLSMRWFIRVL